ncbi:MAG: helix-turn-helix transcriptional regulator [Acidobacteriaceae bacterium]
MSATATLQQSAALPPSPPVSRPQWTVMIERMRESQGWSQAALARRLQVSPMAVSRWERGINEPSSSIYVELGKITGAPECWYFWGLAGLTRSDIDKALGVAANA